MDLHTFAKELKSCVENPSTDHFYLCNHAKRLYGLRGMEAIQELITHEYREEVELWFDGDFDWSKSYSSEAEFRRAAYPSLIQLKKRRERLSKEDQKYHSRYAKQQVRIDFLDMLLGYPNIELW